MKELTINLNLTVDIMEYLSLHNLNLNISKSSVSDDITIQVIKLKKDK